jgi:hypothetical protein
MSEAVFFDNQPVLIVGILLLDVHWRNKNVGNRDGFCEGDGETIAIVDKEKDLFPEVCCKEETMRLVERCHFFILGGFEIHRTVETSDVVVS